MRKKMVMMIMMDSEVIEEKVLYIAENNEDWETSTDPTDDALYFFY